jgi:hypothetical protein
MPPQATSKQPPLSGCIETPHETQQLFKAFLTYS